MVLFFVIACIILFAFMAMMLNSNNGLNISLKFACLAMAVWSTIVFADMHYGKIDVDGKEVVAEKK